MTDDEIKHRVETSPALSRAANQLRDEIGFRAAASAQFDPMLVIMVISIIIQIIIHCRETRSAAAIKFDIRELRTLPARRLMRLRRKLNKLWREKAAGGEDSENPLVAAIYEMSDSVDDEAINELMRLAEDSGAA